MKNIITIMQENKDGATLDPQSLAPVNVSSGYAVALTDNAVHNFTAKTAKDIEKLTKKINTIARFLNLDTYYIGYWLDEKTNIGYLDISIIVQDKKQALAIAQQHNQKAIFNFSTFRSLYLA